MASHPPEIALNGARILPGALDAAGQRILLEEVRAVARAAPLITQTGPGGRPMSVRMTAAGRFGWLTEGGYHYSDRQPDGRPWPVIPPTALRLWQTHCGVDRAPECCLVNFYGEGARMGLHQDRDEADFSWPVLSISLGDDGLFRVGGDTRRAPTRSHWIKSGDVVVLEGPARLAYHGIDRIRFGSSTLLSEGGRLNLTLRVVT